MRVRYARTQTQAARLGIIVPKKGNRLAVRRNRIKRMIRNEFRLIRHRLSPMDIIVHVTGPIDDADLVMRLRQDLATLVIGKGP